MTTQTKLTSGGRTLDVYDAGPARGPLLLFHHGTPGAGIPFDLFAKACQKRGLRLVSFSRAGYGGSSRRPDRTVADVAMDAASVLDYFGEPTCLTVGWSGGGPHALACAALLPERVTGAAVIGSVAPRDAAGLDWYDGMAEGNCVEFGAAEAGPAPLDDYLRAPAEAKRGLTAAEVTASLAGMASPVDAAALEGDIAEYVAATFREGVREGHWGWFDDDLAFVRPWGFTIDSVKVPVSVWHGEQDRMVPCAHGRWLAEQIPGCRPHFYPQHGHLSLPVDCFELVLDESLQS